MAWLPPRLARWLLAGARPRCIHSRLPRFRIVAALKMGAPHTLSAHAGRSLVSRNRRGSPSLRVPATSNCGHGGVLRGWDTTASTRRLATPPWHQRAGVWTGCLVGREHARAATGRRRGHSEVMTLRRFRDTTTVMACSDKVCGATSSALHRSSIVVTGPRDTRAERRRATTQAERRRATEMPSGGEQRASAGRGSRSQPSGRSPPARSAAATGRSVRAPR